MKSGACRRQHVRDEMVKRYLDEKASILTRKAYLATKYVVGLGRVGEIFVVYRREIRKNENSGKAAKVWDGEKIMDMRE